MSAAFARDCQLNVSMDQNDVENVPPCCRKNQARKRNPNPNFLVRIFSGGVRVFHLKGWGPKSSVCPSKPGKLNFFGGISRDFAGISRRRPKSLRKKVCVQVSLQKKKVNEEEISEAFAREWTKVNGGDLRLKESNRAKSIQCSVYVSYT